MHVHAYIVWNRKCPIFCYRGSTIKISSQIWTPSPSFLSRHTLIPLFPSVPLPRRHPSAPLLCIHHSLLLELIRERAQQRFSFLPMYARQDQAMAQSLFSFSWRSGNSDISCDGPASLIILPDLPDSGSDISSDGHHTAAVWCPRHWRLPLAMVSGGKLNIWILSFGSLWFALNGTRWFLCDDVTTRTIL